MAYTYLIGWSTKNKWYYGLRYSKDASPDDLWETYFTSSKYVKDYRDEYGEPDVIQIRRVFSCVKKARHWEHNIIRKMKMIHHDKWLNRTDNISIYLDPEIRRLASIKSGITQKGRPGKRPSKETLHKQALKRIGYLWWNNSIIEIKSKTAPAGFIRGRLWKPSALQKAENSKLHKGNQYNKGRKQTIRSNEKRSKTLKKIGMRWWNDGEHEVFSTTCPPSYFHGRLKQSSPV